MMCCRCRLELSAGEVGCSHPAIVGAHPTSWIEASNARPAADRRRWFLTVMMQHHLRKVTSHKPLGRGSSVTHQLQSSERQGDAMACALDSSGNRRNPDARRGDCGGGTTPILRPNPGPRQELVPSFVRERKSNDEVRTLASLMCRK
jgi:hypothetical protein